MADLIDRQTAIDALCNDLCGGNHDCRYYPNCDNLKPIQVLPSADAVEVVRCKDCYHYDEESEKCILNNSEMKPMDYCSYGSK